MLTPVQFAALAAAALPTACPATASIACYQQAGSFYTDYRVTYRVPRGTGAEEVVGPEMGCPFAAVSRAVEEVYCLHLISPAAYFTAARTLEQAQQAPAYA